MQSTDLTSLNRIKRIINEVYLDEVVPAQQWKWLRKRINLSHTPKITTGTVSVTQHSPNLTFSTAPGLSQQGYYFSVDGSNDVYRVLSHTANSTTAVLEVPYTQTTDTAASFKLWSEGIPLPADCRETFQVLHYNSDVPLEGVGLNKFREITITQPKAEGPPQWYTTTDFRDPDPYSSITSLPAISTRSSSGVIKTLVFATDVSSYLREGDRIRIDSAGHYSYGGEAIVSNVSTTTLTYTGTIEYVESAIADLTLTVKLFNQEKSSERYRELLIYPSIYDQRVTLHLDYIQEVQPLENASDEPMMPISDRIVLKYGALKEAWAFFDRNEEEASRYEAKFQAKLARMSGGLDDSTDMPTLTPSKLYMGSKRNQARTRDTKRYWGGGVNTGGASSQPTITSTASRVAVFDGTGTLTASTAIDTTELALLDGLVAPILTTTNTKTVTNKSIDAASNTITNISNTEIKTGAAITRTKLATGTAYRILANDSSGAISENAALTATRPVVSDTNGQLSTPAATLPPSLGGTGVANNDSATITRSGNHAVTLTTTNTTSVTLPTAGTLATLAGTEALTNKTLDTTNTITLKDNLFTLQDDGDLTKQAKFQASGITAGQTRTLTIPDASTTILGTDNTATVSNKTLTTAVNTFQGLEWAKNFLVNSNYDYWQATTSITIANTVSTYGPDQWYGKNSLGTNGVLTLSQVTGSSDGAKFGCKLLISTAPTAAQTNGCELYQTLDNLSSLPLYNQTASFSIKVKAFGNVNQVGIQFYYKTTEAKVDTAIGSETLTTVNTSTFTTCSISGQALGTSQTTSGVIGVRIRITAVSSGNAYDLNNGFSVEQGIVNLGTVPASYQRAGRTIAEELIMCQRFYEKSYEVGTIGPANTEVGQFSFTNSTATQKASCVFQVRKRTAPTVTIYNPSDSTSAQMRNQESGGTLTVSSTVTSERAFHPTTSAAGTTSNLHHYQWIADARI